MLSPRRREFGAELPGLLSAKLAADKLSGIYQRLELAEGGRARVVLHAAVWREHQAFGGDVFKRRPDAASNNLDRLDPHCRGRARPG